MFKVKNVFITFAILYVIVAVATAFVELDNVVNTCADIRTTVSLAADMALQQATASDEMFSNISIGGQYGVNDVKDITTIQVATSGEDNYTSKNIFELTYNIDNINSLAGKKKLFKTMYFDADNALFAKNDGFLNALLQIKTNIAGNNIPNLAQIGLLDGVKDNDNPFPLADVVRNNDGVSKYLASIKNNNFGGNDWLYLKSVQKDYELMNGTKEHYFLAPTNVGVTYIDPNVLHNAFVCNMDLIMRAGVNGNLTAQSGVSTVVGNSTEADVATNANDINNIIDSYNIIHDKNMVFVKGKYNANGGFAISDNNNAKPKIEYQVIDLCDVKNKELVRLALGVNFGDKGLTDETYKEWLVSLGLRPGGDAKDPMSQKYICVAKVTVYADVMVSYSTLMGRQINAMYARYLQDDTVNGLYNDKGVSAANLQCIPYTATKLETIKEDNPDAHYSPVSGNAMYEYVTYYAVM